MSYEFVEQHAGYTVGRKFYPPADTPYPLGRNVRHDSRSLSFQVRAKDISELKSVKHHRFIPTLNQGSLGSCTGNAGTGALGTALFWEEGQHILSPTDAIADEHYAITLYSDATKIDPYQGDYPPSDTGSDGLSIAKVLQNRGLISGYVHATSLEAALTALEESPVLGGVEWRSDMFHPDPDGHVHITGSIAGGHEIVFDELDVENKRVWFTNSWGERWGVHGRAYLTWDDFATLLSRAGDITQLIPVTEPAPTPEPTPPSPQPQPAPDMEILQEVIDAAKALIASLEKLIGNET